jgi:hypothetical protein
MYCIWSDILDRARAVEADDLEWRWDTFVVVGIVVVDAAAEFGVDELRDVAVFFNLNYVHVSNG